jgi:hypothetical protein
MALDPAAPGERVCSSGKSISLGASYFYEMEK